MATRQITIDLKTILDSGWAYGVVSFEMVTDVATSGTTVYPQSLQKIQTDVDGVGAVNLAVPTTGAFVYEVRLPSTQEAQIVVEAGATVTLAELLTTGLTPVPPSGDSYWVRLDGTNTPMTGDLSFASAGIVDADTVGFNELYVTTGLEPVGTQYWDSVREEMAFTVDDFGSITIGKEIWDKMTNLSGVPVVNGDIVSTASATGNRQAFTLTDATDTAKSIACIGMVTVPTINANANGRVTKSGIVRGLNTDAFTEGSIVYVDPLNPGKLTQTQPQAPNFTISVGTVTVKHPTEGIINVNIRIVGKMEDLSDVNGTPLTTDGQFFVWDNASMFFDATANTSDFSPTLSNVIYVDPSFTSATVGWGVTAFATLGTAIAAAVSGDTIYVNGITTEAGALVIPSGVHVYVMQNSRVTTNGVGTLAAVTLAGSTASFLVAGQNSAGGLAAGNHSGVGNGGGELTASGDYSGVGSGGSGNTASGDYSGVGSGGDTKNASGLNAGVGNGGGELTASGDYSGVGSGGGIKTASGRSAGVGSGGSSITASGDYSGVGNGGSNSEASGDYSGVLTASRRAKATHQGSKLSSDSQNFDFSSAAIDEFAVRAAGGVRLVTAIDGLGAPTATHKLTDVLNSLPYVALASLPLASTAPGAIAATSDGGTGSTPALMYSNGTVWEALADTADVVPKTADILSKSALYTLTAADAAKIIECDGTFTITAPDGLPTGFQVAIANVGTGVITVAATTTLQSKSAAVTLANQYGMATLYHRGSNVWLLAGDLT